MLRNLIVAVALVLGVSACTAAIESGVSGARTLAAVSPEAHAKFLADTKAAHSIFVASDDTMGEQCTAYVVSYLEANPPAGDAEAIAIEGVFSAYAKGRAVRRAVTGQEGLSDAFWIACGPMLSESRAFIEDAFGDIGRRILSPL
jgi:hypothetical protein